uniref:ubiquitinyl hydrolase 1 n=1 Tax=Tetraodon nigroviridis TaxID=99883 RepID=H3CDG1_TETNG
MQVLDNNSVLKVERKFLHEIPAEFSGLLEPVSDPEARLKLLNNPAKLQQLANLPLDAPLWVQTGKQDDLAEAELKYIGPLTRGSSAVIFGGPTPQGSAAGRGTSNGSYKGHRLFTCPEGCAIFVPVSHASGILPRTGESAPAAAQGQNHVRGPASPPPFQVGQRVCFPVDDAVHAGEVRFCGLLPGRSSAGMYVGVLLDTPFGNWDGYYKEEKLCHIPSPLYGQLLPLTKVSPAVSNCTSLKGPIIIKPRTAFLSFRAQKSSPQSSSPTRDTSDCETPANIPACLHFQDSPDASDQTSAESTSFAAPEAHRQAAAASPTPQTRRPDVTLGSRAADLPSPLRSPDSDDTVGEDEGAAPDGKLEVGSMVEVNDPPLFGVIRWIGRIGGIPEQVAGIELDQEISAGTDGSYLGQRHFRCPANRGLFVKLRNCRRDSRFPAPETPVNQVERCNSVAFAEWGSERVDEHTPPLEGGEASELYQGWKRGIQGHLNSCYLECTLFSMFSCCSSADWLLFWPTDAETQPKSEQAQDLLRCEIVNPLRRYGYVCASKTMALRRLLEAANSDEGFTNQEKDPEEFLNKLFQLLQVEPLLKISRSMTQQPQECHLYQLFPPTFRRMRVASVQTLMESSFLHAGLKLVEAPSCLLLLMPRFGKDFKMFDAILPTLSLDVTDLLDDTLRQCSICQMVAEWECFQCYEDVDITPGHLKQYCQTCNTQVHNHRKRVSHSPVKMSIPEGKWSGPLHCARQHMSLFAVTCIETSHYVSFVKHGPLITDWLFFDSMADREGGENGFNIPHVKACPEVGRYLSLSEDALSRVDPASLREPVRRLLCDSYMCLYHSPELSLYK